ncbi:MAG: hypothetical protein CVU14_03305 [Bacteroidetes bacterium HGW-Bacteroidetes-9]|jgi:type I restriction enzyme S subunit|nr:MAG: hypothetical protein CVU14_03305 [Bacteroidetes bacterium HGW-Bacteroidetes-9]
MSIKSKLPSDWSLTQLEDMCNPKGLVRGPFGGALKKEFFVEQGYKVYEQKNAIYRDEDLGDYFVDAKLFSSLKRFAVKPRDFIVSCSGTIGRIFQIPDNAKEGIINQALLKITTDGSIVDGNYFFQYFDWDKFQSKIIDNTQGGAMQNLVGMDIFRKTEIPLPPLPEQRAIAQVLSTADAAIHTTEKLITQKELRKKWLMQQLLTGKKRLKGFGGEWKEHSYEKILKVVKRNFDWNENELYKLISVRRRSGGIFYREALFGHQILVKNLRTANEGDFLFSKMQILHGASALVTKEFDGAKISGSYISVVPKDNNMLNMEFFQWYSQTPYFYHQTYISSYGVHIEKMTFDFDTFLQLEMKLPSIEEQTAISQVLQVADKEISLLKVKADKLRELKKGMMQVLLTGKVRLKIN